MHFLTRFVCYAYAAYAVLPNLYISKYILIKLEDSTVENTIYSSYNDDSDYPVPQEESQKLLKDDKNISSLTERRLNQQNIKASFRMFLKGPSGSLNGTFL